MTVHPCDGLIIACIDFRFQKYIQSWLGKNFQNKTYDYVGYAGASKNLKIILEQLSISVRLHQIKQVVIIHHENCGAYGDESTPERHAQDLKKAEKKIAKLYPNLQVDLYYLHLDGIFEKVR